MRQDEYDPNVNILEQDFMECNLCSSKTGSPELCPACLHNRRVVHALQREIKKYDECIDKAIIKLDKIGKGFIK